MWANALRYTNIDADAVPVLKNGSFASPI
jgi:hypothetical protein